MKIRLPAAYFSAVLMLTGCGGGSPSEPAAALTAAASTSASVTAAPSLKWIPKITDTWQWQLRGVINTAYPVNVYDIDLFNASQSTIDLLKTQGKRVVCYFSAGSSENFRTDFGQFLPQDMGTDLVSWPGERWLDTRSANVRAIMKTRLDLAAAKGCDGVEPDNVDGYTNNSGFPLTNVTQLEYNAFLAAEAHARGMAIALKNDVAQINSLVAMFDFAVNEQCFQFNECAGYAAFVAQGKPVFNAEYAAQYQNDLAGARQALCATSKSLNFHTLVLPLQLDDSSRISCD